MKEHDLKKSMMAKFKATGLLPYLVTHQQQLFEIPDGFFAEIVLSDASKLREAEKLIASIQQEVEDEGSHIIPIVRAVWSVKKIEALGQSRGVSGGVKAASDFRVVLESGKREAEAFVEVIDTAARELRTKLGDEDHILEAVREFVKLQLSFGGAGYWDPLRHPRLVLNSSAAAYLVTRGLPTTA